MKRILGLAVLLTLLGGCSYNHRTDIINGIDGIDGQNGENGLDGKSAYELWTEIEGNEEGSLYDFFLSLVGAQGVPGIQGPQGEQGIQGASCTVTDTGSGAIVACGSEGGVLIKDGRNGKDGKDGAPGSSITVSSLPADPTKCDGRGGIEVSDGSGTSQLVCNGANGNDGQDGLVTVANGGVGVVKFCADESSVEYGLAIGGDLYAVNHTEMCKKGNKFEQCPKDRSNTDNYAYSNTYLAKLKAGSNYITTDGIGCEFKFTKTSKTDGGCSFTFTSKTGGTASSRTVNFADCSAQ